MADTPQTTSYSNQSSNSTGSSMDMVSGIISGVADVGNTVNSIISTYYQLKATKASEKKAYALAEQQRQDVLAQNKIENMFKQQGLDLQRQGLSWEKMKWGQTWGLTKQQYRDQRNAQLAQAQRQGKLDAVGAFNNLLNQSNNQMNQTVGRMGV